MSVYSSRYLGGSPEPNFHRMGTLKSKSQNGFLFIGKVAEASRQTIFCVLSIARNLSIIYYERIVFVLQKSTSCFVDLSMRIFLVKMAPRRTSEFNGVLCGLRYFNVVLFAIFTRVCSYFTYDKKPLDILLSERHFV